MASDYSTRLPLPDTPLFKERGARLPLQFELELTARCNCDCRHCYINQPAGDGQAKASELSLAEIERIAGEAVDLGALWCLLTGGEPLLREDFADVYLALKRKGLLVSVFTNATLVTPGHVDLLRKYPPRDVEVTVYGVTRETYERVTRRPGSFDAFRRGLDLLLDGGVKVRLKAMALRSNVHELPEIARFCREHTKDYFRFDPLLHLRFDGDPERNEEIRAERLSPAEIVEIERQDDERFRALQKDCERLTDSGCQDVSLRPPLPLRRRQRQLRRGLRRPVPAVLVAVAPGHHRRPAPDDPARGLGATRAPGARHDLATARVPGELPPLPAGQPVPLVPGARPPGNRRAGCLPGVLLPGRPRARPRHRREQVARGAGIPTVRAAGGTSLDRRRKAAATRSHGLRAGPVLAYGTRHGRRADKNDSHRSRRVFHPFRHLHGDPAMMRVLIAEAHASIRRSLGRLLTRLGYGVVATDNARQALAVLDGQHPPELALLDSDMPGIHKLGMVDRSPERPDVVATYLLIRRKRRYTPIPVYLLRAGDGTDTQAGKDDGLRLEIGKVSVERTTLPRLPSRAPGKANEGTGLRHGLAAGASGRVERHRATWPEARPRQSERASHEPVALAGRVAHRWSTRARSCRPTDGDSRRNHVGAPTSGERKPRSIASRAWSRGCTQWKHGDLAARS